MDKKQQYRIPHQIDGGFLCIPEFLFEGVRALVPGAEKGQSGVPELFENKKLKYPFQELRIYGETNHPEIVDKLIACRIPFHFNFTYQEDMEVEYWQGLNKATEDCMLGFDTTVAASKRPNQYLDVDWLNAYLTNIQAQLTLLGGNVQDLLDARDMYDPDK